MPSVAAQAVDEIAEEIGKLENASNFGVFRRALLSDDKGQWSNLQSGIYVFDSAEEDEAAGTNERDDIGYGISVVIVKGTSGGISEGLESLRDFREKVRRRFHNQRLRKVVLEGSHHCTCRVSHGPRRQRTKDDRYEISSLIIRVWMREARS